MPLKVMPNYFLVRLEKEKQKQFKDRISNLNSLLYQSSSGIFHSKNMEHGQIIQIGDRVKEMEGFEGCRIGHILIFHWSVEAPQENTAKRFFIHEDETYNYYVVDEPNVKGYFDGKTITPNANYIFLKNLPVTYSKGQYDAELGAKIKEVNGIITFSDWKESAESIAQKSDYLQKRIQSLAKSGRTPQIQKAMEEMENERKRMNREIKKQKFLPYKVAFSNPVIDRNFGTPLKDDDIVYCLNYACMYLCNFQIYDYKFIICPSEYIGLLDRRDKQIA